MINHLLKVFGGKRSNLTFASSQIENWILPPWFVKQSDPLGPGYVFDGYRFANISYRNWTTLYNAGDQGILTVDRDGTVSISKLGVSIEIWINDGETLFTPGRFLQTEQKAALEFPCIETKSTFPKGTCTSRVFLIDGCPNISFGIELQIEAVSEDTFANFLLFLVVRPYDHNGITGINRLEYKNRGIKVNNSNLFQVETEPKVIYCTHAGLGDVGEYFKLGQNKLSSVSMDGSCTGIIGYAIRPAEQNRVKVFYKAHNLNSFLRNDKDHHAKWLYGSRQSWISRYLFQHQLLRIDSQISHLYHTNLNYLLMFTEASSGSADVYHILALNRFALTRRSRDYLKKALKTVRWDGSLSGVNMTPAKLVYALVDYYKFSSDAKIIKENWQIIRRIGFWLVQNKPIVPFKDNPECYEDLGWFCASFKALALLGEVNGSMEEYQFFHQHFQELWSQILGFFSRKFKDNHGVLKKVGSVSRAVAGLCLSYPLQLYQKNEKFIMEWLNQISEKHLLNGGVLSPMEFQGVDLEFTARLGAALLREGREWESTFKFLCEKVSPTGSWPDRIHPVLGEGIGRTGHAPGVGCQFLLLLRNIMVMEEGAALYLLPGIFTGEIWRDTKIELRHFPTSFGAINLKCKIIGNIIQIEFEATYRIKPQQIRLILSEDYHLLYSESPILNQGDYLELEPDFKIIRLRRAPK